MKKLKYQLMLEVNRGTDERPNIEKIFTNKEWLTTTASYDSDLLIVKAEAYKGEVTVEDVPDEPREPTQAEQLRADVDFLAVMTGVML